MALFDKPFRYVPQADPADTVSGSDVAVVDSVVSASSEPVSPTGDASPAGAPKAIVEATPQDAPVPSAVEAAAAADTSTPAVADPVAEAIQPARVNPVVEAAQPPSVDPALEAAQPPRVDLAIEAPKPSVVPVVDAAVTPVVAPVVATTTLAAEPVAAHLPERVSAAAVTQPVAELVAREDHGLRPASDGPGLTVFSRVVPSESKSMTLSDSQRLVNGIDDAEPVLDQLRSLAASLHQARTGREMRVIAVTSSVSGEGKTLLAANLALTLSRSYMRQVLLIDADLRRPNLHRLFGIPSQEGIRTALESVREGKPVAVQDVAPRLALLPAGKPVRDPISVLASDAMQRLMTAATNTFDWVIVDTPPVGMLPDVGLLSSLSDAVLLVVEAGRVRYDLVQRTVESIGADRIFGVVLNKVPEREIVASYGMHYYAPYR